MVTIQKPSGLTQDASYLQMIMSSIISNHLNPIYLTWYQLLFPDDHVYLNDNAERKEYVLKDSGRMFVGDHNYMSPRPWRYGQVSIENE